MGKIEELVIVIGVLRSFHIDKRNIQNYNRPVYSNHRGGLTRCKGV